MRRLAFAAAVCGTLVFAACNDQTPTEPAVPRPSENLGSCRATPFPLLGTNGIAQQIANIYPGTSKAQTLLRAEAVAQAAAIKLLWDTCHPDAARKAAFIFIDWLNRHTPAGKETQVQNLILAVLKGIGEITTAGDPGDFGVGFFDPKNPNKTLITTVNHHAFIQLDPGSFLVPTEIVIGRKAGDPPLTNFEGRQFPPTYDYNAINSTNTHVLQPGKTANIAFCLVVIGPPTMEGNGYPDPANLRIGHNPVAGAPGFPFEILEPFDLEGTALRRSLTCPGIDDVIGSAGGGLQNFANAALYTAGRFLLPQPLWAATLGTLPPPPPLSGKAGSLSPFKPVEVISNQVENYGSDLGASEQGPYYAGEPLDRCNDGCFPRYRVTDGEVPITTPTNLTVSLLRGEGSTGTLSGTLTQPTSATSPYAAEFDDLVISQPGTYQLLVSAPGVASYTTGNFVVGPPPPNEFLLTGDPSDGTFFEHEIMQLPCEGACYPGVRLVDSHGQGVGGVEVTVTLVHVEGAGTFEPANITMVTTSDDAEGGAGYAVFNNLSISEAGTYALTFSAPGANDKMTGSFFVSASE
jgi:hypothetical protein